MALLYFATYGVMFCFILFFNHVLICFVYREKEYDIYFKLKRNQVRNQTFLSWNYKKGNGKVLSSLIKSTPALMSTIIADHC